jgi:hypothetical protein
VKTKLLWVAGVLALLAYFAYLTMTPNVVSCEVCIEYGGRTECRKASGKDRAEAERSATSTACSLLAGGVASSIACQNTPPSKSDCQER